MNREQIRHRLAFLDGLRGLAALYVLIFHARWLMWEGFAEGFVKHPEQYSIFGKLLAYASLAFYYGHQAVILFFILSGFVIHLRYADRLKREGQSARFDWRQYVYRRVKRIYPPLLFAMILTVVADAIGMAQNYSIYRHQTPYYLINLNVTPNYGWQNGIGNLLAILGIPDWGTNIPLWSLKFEWWFYMLYPLFWWLTRRSIGLATGILSILFVLSFFPGLWPLDLIRSAFSLMIVWWFGALLADVYTKRLPISLAKIAPLAGLLLILPFMVSPLVEMNTTIQDFLWGLGFTGLLAGLLAWQNRGHSLRLLERLKPLGDMSYTLYAIHVPILVLVSGSLMAANQTLPAHFGWIVLGCAFCLGLAYIGHLLVERPFVTSRRLPKPVFPVAPPSS
jgi:peptidoglycan/LPS O-acetylase OafA/YrhL